MVEWKSSKKSTYGSE